MVIKRAREAEDAPVDNPPTHVNVPSPKSMCTGDVADVFDASRRRTLIDNLQQAVKEFVSSMERDSVSSALSGDSSLSDLVRKDHAKQDAEHASRVSSSYFLHWQITLLSTS